MSSKKPLTECVKDSNEDSSGKISVNKFRTLLVISSNHKTFRYEEIFNFKSKCEPECRQFLFTKWI